MEYPELEGWMTVAQAADLKMVSHEAVLRAVRDGRVKGHRIGRVTLVRRESVEEWQPKHGGSRKKKD